MNEKIIKKKLGIPSSVVYKSVKIFVGIPTRGMINANWIAPILKQSLPVNTSIEYRFLIGEEVGTAREKLAEMAIALRADYLIFVDDDVIIPPNAIAKLCNLADEGRDIVAGVYYSKQIPPQPLVFKGRGTGSYKKWKIGEIIEDADGVGMGLTLIKTEILKKIKKPWFKTINVQKQIVNNEEIFLGKDENLYFFDKVISHGFKITIDTGIQGIHYDHKTDSFYFNDEGVPVVVTKGEVVFPKNP